jgi:hypothetical protein
MSPVEREEFSKKVENYLKETNTTSWIFARRVSSDYELAQRIIGKKGKGIRLKTVAKVLKLMKDNPEGLTRKEPGPRLIQQVQPGGESKQRPYVEGEEPHSDPCVWCGVRGELGCKHRLPYEPTGFDLPWPRDYLK